MMNLLLLLIFLTSVILCVYSLNRYNDSIRQQNRKRSQPLPPMGNLETKSTNKIEGKDKKISIVTNQIPTPSKNQSNWRQLALEMRKKNQIEPAFNLCESKFPLYTAYREATLILKSILQNEGLSQAKIQRTLSQLYKIAAIAELIYAKKSAGGTLLPDKLKTMDITLLHKIPFDYNKLGYLELPLLKKQDTRLLVSHWGEPDKHDSPRNLYESHFIKLISSQKR